MYQFGSITKQFTAAAILQLVEAGKLALEDPLGKYVTTYAPGDNVAIRQLLCIDTNGKIAGMHFGPPQ